MSVRPLRECPPPLILALSEDRLGALDMEAFWAKIHPLISRVKRLYSNTLESRLSANHLKYVACDA